MLPAGEAQQLTLKRAYCFLLSLFFALSTTSTGRAATGLTRIGGTASGPPWCTPGKFVDVATTAQLSQAIASNGTARCIRLAPRRFALDAALVIRRQLALIGSGPALTVLDAGAGQNAQSWRVVTVAPEADAWLSDLQITGGSSADGGGVDIQMNARLAMVGCVVSGNRAAGGYGDNGGGGVFVEEGGVLTMNGSAITSNKASYRSGMYNGYGGAGLCNQGTADLSDCTISANVASYDEVQIRGGGVLNTVRSLTFFFRARSPWLSTIDSTRAFQILLSSPRLPTCTHTQPRRRRAGNANNAQHDCER